MKADRTKRGRSRSLWLALAFVGLGGYLWLALQVYRSTTDPEGFASKNRPFAGLVGPSATALEAAVGRQIARSLELLEDRSLAAPERIRAYRDELRVAQSLLLRSLRSQPAQAHALAQLAAIRWELEPPLTERATRRTLATVALASSMAPTAPRVQLKLGELLLRMGRPGEAADYLHRTVSLDPRMSDDVVALLRQAMLGAEEILAVLPGEPEVLASLQRAFVEDDQARIYLDVVEARLAANTGTTSRLLQAYGAVCLRVGQAERLRDRMTLLGPRADSDSEAERLRQRSRAHLATGDAPAALDDARQAWSRAPLPSYGEHLGDVLLATGSGSDAIRAFRDSLRIVASTSGIATTRARLYRKIGQAEDYRGRVDKAYDAYKLALQLDADEAFARRRIEEMEAAAGFLGLSQ